MTQGPWYRFDADGDLLVLRIRVQPNAARTEIAGLYGDRLRIRVAAPPVDHKANVLLLDFLKKTLDLPGSRVMIRRGSHGRDKIIEISHPGAAVLDTVKRLAPT